MLQPLKKLACVQETVLNRSRSILTDVFARADSSLDRRALQRELDWELLGSSEKRKQLLYIKNPFNFFRQKFAQRYDELERRAQARISDARTEEVNG